MRWKNSLLSLAVVFFVFLPAAGWPQQTTTAAPTKTPTLRFDGVYETKRTTRTSNDYYRFFEDGKVLESSGESAEKGALFLTEEDRAFAGSNGGEYNTRGSRIEITFGARKLIGSIEQDRIKIKEGRWIGGSPLAGEEWVFIPFDFAEFERKREAAFLAQRARGAAGMQLVMGTVVWDERCDKVDFTSAREPVQFPPGTLELAYQVSSIPEEEDVSVNLASVNPAGVCGTRGLRTRRCNKYSIVMGRPVVTSWTAKMQCGDGEPFESGAYNLQLISGERLVKAIRFEIK